MGSLGIPWQRVRAVVTPRLIRLMWLASLTAAALGGSERPSYASAVDARNGQLKFGIGDPELWGPNFARAQSPASQAHADRWLATAGALPGFEMAHIYLDWSALVRRGTSPRDGWDPWDRAYDFERLDQLVRANTRAGMETLITVMGAPDWAESPFDRSSFAKPGTWKPDPIALHDFARALATRYSGSYSPSLDSAPLPRVRYFEVWNEPNLPSFLAPSFTNGSRSSVDWYRRLVNAMSTGIRLVQPDATVIAGALSPGGFAPIPSSSPRAAHRPLHFLKELLCLKPRCTHVLRADALSFHAIPIPRASKFTSTAERCASAVGGIGISCYPGDMNPFKPQILRTMGNAAKRRGTFKGFNGDIWATEAWLHTTPPEPGASSCAVSEGMQARQFSRLILSLASARVSHLLFYTIVDRLKTHSTNCWWNSSGLFREGGEAKSVVASLPLSIRSHWSRARNSALIVDQVSMRSGRSVIEGRYKSGWRRLAVVAVTRGRLKRSAVKVRGPTRPRSVRARMGATVSLASKPRR